MNTRHSVQHPPEKMPLFSRFAKIIIFLIFVSAIYLVFSFKPLSKEEQMEGFSKMDETIEPFRKNLSECARQVKASKLDVQNFLKRIPQTTMEGKCFVACILRRNALITKDRINMHNLLEANKSLYGEHSEIWQALQKAVNECTAIVSDIFEICEYASIFNDCMHVKTENMLEKATMERRMEAMGDVAPEPDYWSDDDDEMLKLIKDEL